MARVGRTAVGVGCAALLIVAILSDERTIQIAAISIVLLTAITVFAVAVVRTNRRIEADLATLRNGPTEVEDSQESERQRRYGT